MSGVLTSFRTKPNSLDYPLVDAAVTDAKKTCPVCHSHLKTVLRKTTGPDSAEVECLTDKIAFRWRQQS